MTPWTCAGRRALFNTGGAARQVPNYWLHPLQLGSARRGGPGNVYGVAAAAWCSNNIICVRTACKSWNKDCQMEMAAAGKHILLTARTYFCRNVVKKIVRRAAKRRSEACRKLVYLGQKGDFLSGFLCPRRPKVARGWLAQQQRRESDAPPVTDGHGNERSHPLLVPVPQGRSFAGDRPGVRENLLFLTTISSFFSSLFSSP